MLKNNKYNSVKKSCLGTRIKNQSMMWLLLLPTTFALVMFIIYPILSGIILSFFHVKGFSPTTFCGLENYKNVLHDTLFMKTLTNSLLYVFWSLVIGFLPPLAFAIMLDEVVHFKQGFKFITYLPAVTPALAVSLLWTSIYNSVTGGLLNMIIARFGIPAQQWLGNPNLALPLIIVSMTWNGYGSTMLLYLAALQGVNRDLYEAALIDGAGIWRRLFKITLPKIAPTMLLLGVRQMIGVFQIMDQPLVMTDGGPNNATMSINLASYKMAFTYMQVDRSLALGVVAFGILLILTIAYFRLDKKLGA